LAGAVAVVGALALLLAGCSSNNPAAPSTSTGATAAGTTTVPASGTAIITGKVVNSSGLSGSTGLGGLTVRLIDGSGNVLRNYSTLGSGEFFFSELDGGVYVLKVESNSDFQGTSILVTAEAGKTVEASNIPLSSLLKVSDVSTVDISGVLIAALDKTAFSGAQVILDGDLGRSTITLANGYFYIPYVASGTHNLFVSKPGSVASFSITFDVIGQTGNSVAQKVTFLGEDIVPVVNNEPDAKGSSIGATRLVQLGDIPVTYTIHHSGVLIGTVQAIYQGLKYPVKNFPFTLLSYDPEDKTAARFTEVITDDRGTWKVDNIPPFQDNGDFWFGIASGTTVNILTNADGDPVGYTLSNLNLPWDANNSKTVDAGDLATNYNTPIYKVSAGETTHMDIVLPNTVDWTDWIVK
jgi:hypothetical protein